MMALGALIWDVLVCPFTTVTILTSCWIWLKFSLDEWDSRNFSVSYNDFVRKRQWWRAISSPLCHTSLLHLIINVMVIWNCRLTELNMGTLFIMRYSLIMAVSEAILTNLLIFCTITYTPLGANIEPMLVTTSSFGASGVLMGWLTFQSISYANYAIKKHFVIFGFLGFQQELCSLIMSFIFYWVTPRHNLLSNLCGLVSGYLLYSGALQIAPNFYWSLCCLLNIALLAVWSLLTNQTAVLPRSVHDGGEELVEVVSYEGSATAGSEGNSSPNRRRIAYNNEDIGDDLEAGRGLLEDRGEQDCESGGGGGDITQGGELIGGSAVEEVGMPPRKIGVIAVAGEAV